MGNYEQLEMDLRLDYERSLKDNVQTVVRFNHGTYMEETYPSKVNNHHEGYGILSENETVLTRAVKSVRGDMDTFLKVLPNGEADAISTCGSIYNSCVMTAVAAVQMATQAKRILDDLYDPVTPIEQAIEDAGDMEDGFEEAVEAQETLDDDMDEEDKE